jgi:hypothetical protein
MQIIISKKSDPGFRSDSDWERLFRAADREVPDADPLYAYMHRGGMEMYIKANLGCPITSKFKSNKFRRKIHCAAV